MPYLMPNGKWRAQRMIDGKRKSKLFVTKKDAKAWEAEQTEELWNPRQEQLQTLTVCWLELCTEYLKQAEERFSNKTFEEKRLSCKRSLLVVPHDQDAKDVTVAQATEVMRKVGKDSSGYAANKTRKNLAAMWEWGRKIYGLPPENPFRESEKMPADRTPRYVPPEADFWKVYDACKDSRDKALLLFLLHTGARIQEAFRLVWPDIDFERQQIRLGTRKTASGGMEYSLIPMTTELKKVLLKHREQSKTLNVFVAQRTGQALTHRQHFMPRACEAAGVTPFGFHAIRHLTATILAQSGLDLPSIQAILRHHNPTTTARYIHSLGVEYETVDAVFSDKKRGAKVTSFGTSK